MIGASLRRGIKTLASRKIYIVMMVIVPLVSAFFFLNLMNEGLPLKVPSGMVDLDRSSMSRSVARNLRATELIEISGEYENFNDALDKVRGGEIFGFFYIPRDFQKDALAGRTPTLSYYSNMTVFVPGTLSFKGFKTIAVTTMGGVVKTTLVSAGIGDDTAGSLLQPVVVQDHPMGNPWTNYSIYLSNSFIPCTLALLVMLVTAFSICHEIKTGSSVQWVATAGGRMWVALLGKLLPQTVVFSIVGIAMQALLYGFLHFPLNNHPMHIITAMILLVTACQAFAVGVCEIVPNLRLSLSICSLTGILSFSIAAFSFPVPQMYGAVGIFSYIVPIRYYFLIYIDQALNGIPIYFSRYYYAALLGFLLLPAVGLNRLKRHALNPVYVP